MEKEKPQLQQPYKGAPRVPHHVLHHAPHQQSEQHTATEARRDSHAGSFSFESFKIGLVILVALIVLFNQWQIYAIANGGGSGGGYRGGTLSAGGTSFEIKNPTGNVAQDVINTLIPTGTPAYGPELGVSFDDPVGSLTKLARLDRAVPTSSLSAEQKQRYVAIDTKISCEFCCSAPAVIDSSGRDLCGCSHSAAIRGLTKYLITTKTADEWSDDAIYAELTRYKSQWYPKNMVEKGVALVSNGLELNAPALNDPALLKKLSGGNTAAIGELPSMVGGC